MPPLPLLWEMGFCLAMWGKVTGAERSTNFTWTFQNFFRVLLYTNYWKKTKNQQKDFKWVTSDFSGALAFSRKAPKSTGDNRSCLKLWWEIYYSHRLNQKTLFTSFFKLPKLLHQTFNVSLYSPVFVSYSFSYHHEISLLLNEISNTIFMTLKVIFLSKVT